MKHIDCIVLQMKIEIKLIIFFKITIIISLFFHVTGPPRPRRMMRETFSSSIQESIPMSFNITESLGKCINKLIKETLSLTFSRSNMNFFNFLRYVYVQRQRSAQVISYLWKKEWVQRNRNSGWMLSKIFMW